MSQYGFPRSPAQIKETVKMILDKTKFETPFNENRHGKTWFYAFLRRHPEIKMSRVEKLEQARAMACTQKTYMHGLTNLKHFANLMILDYLIRYLTVANRDSLCKALHP